MTSSANPEDDILTKQRPYSANPYFKGKQLGSSCPIIVRHEFLNGLDQNKGLDLHKIPDRPQSSINYLTMISNRNRTGSGMKRSISTEYGRPHSGILNSFASLEFLNTLKQENKNSSSNIKPKMKINADQFHSIIYKVKQKKEELDQKIQNLENWRNTYTENKVHAMAGLSGIDFILQLNAKEDPNSKSGQLLEIQRQNNESLKLLRGLSRTSLSKRNLLNLPMKNTVKTSDFFPTTKDNNINHVGFQIENEFQYQNELTEDDYKHNNNRHITEQLDKFESINEIIRHDSPNHQEYRNNLSRENSYEEAFQRVTGTGNNQQKITKINIYNQVLEKTESDNLIQSRMISPKSLGFTIHSSSRKKRIIKKSSMKLGEKIQDTYNSKKNLPKHQDKIALEGKSININHTISTIKTLKEQRNKLSTPNLLTNTAFSNEKLNADFLDNISSKFPNKNQGYYDKNKSSNTKAYQFFGLSSTRTQYSSNKSNNQNFYTQTGKADAATHTHEEKLMKNVVLDSKYFDSYTIGLKNELQAQPTTGKQVVINSWIKRPTN